MCLGASRWRSSTILKIVDDGTDVKKDQVLCELDASGFEELVRTEKIVVDEAKASHLKAKLDLEVARLGLESYSEGERTQIDRDFSGQIALGVRI